MSTGEIEDKWEVLKWTDQIRGSDGLSRAA